MKSETATGCVHDIELEVVELGGKVGDLYLLDLRVLHTPAPIGSDKARGTEGGIRWIDWESAVMGGFPF